MRVPSDTARPPLATPGRLSTTTAPPAGAPVWSPADRTPNPTRGPRGAVLPFRRRRGLPVRRRSRLASFARPFLAALAIVGIPALALWWSGTSPRFALADLEVRGSERVSEGWVRGQLAGMVGRNLVWMPLDSVERTLSSHPWVAGAEVTKELPDRLRVMVVERQPAAVLVTGERSFWVATDGALIAPVTPDEDPAAPLGEAGELLQVRWAASSPSLAIVEAEAVDPQRGRQVLAAAMEAADVLERTVPRWGRDLSAVEVLGDEEFRLEGGVVPFPLLVRSGGAPGSADWRPQELATRIRRLEEILPKLLARHPEPASFDLRFRNRIVVRSAVAGTVPIAERQERGA